MAKVIGVRFKPVGKIYYFDPLDFEIYQGDKVIVETARGIEYGEVVLPLREVDDSEIVPPLKNVIRIATEEDKKKVEENKKKEKEAAKIFVEKVKKHGLEMNLVDVEYTFDQNKVLFYFTADGRIDFRELVKDLAAVFRTRIELRQIGVRDEAKILGGLGICGRPLCCAKYLDDFQPVSIKMAKEQGLSLNPTKISGACGRLMCCLKFEQESYEVLLKTTPKVGAIVETPEGRGVVEKVSLLKGDITVKIEKADDTVMLYECKAKDVKIIKDAQITQSPEEELEPEELEELKELEE